MQITTLKVKLKPNNKQNSKLFACAGVARWAYNHTIATVTEEYDRTGKFVNHYAIRKELTVLKQTEFSWLYDYSNNITKIAIKDADEAFQRFFKKKAKYPRFKAKRRTKPSFGHDPLKIGFTDRYVKIEKLGTVRLVEHGRIPTDVKYYNPRIGYDGLSWYITVGVERIETEDVRESTEPIGVDLGIKALATVSDGRVFLAVDVRKKIKHLKHLQRIAARKLEHSKKGERKSKNLVKAERNVLIARRKITNIRHNQTHQLTTSLVRTKPRWITIEDLNVAGMVKNHCLARSIQDSYFGESRRQLEYKTGWNGVELKIADRFYPSSQLCNSCHSRQKLTLNDRTYICPNCGLVIDRDLNAAINLRDYTDSWSGIYACGLAS